jgi:hypothetical protein
MAWLLGCAHAAAQALVVEAVQYPAWLERDGRSVPLAPGTVLLARDRLRTGGNARVRLKLADASVVKLGENARFTVERAEDRDVYRASFAVLAGAFRFTTQALDKVRRRDVSIKVKDVSVGIRGTDVWGKSSAERDLVCLIEGRVRVSAAGHAAATLAQPLDLYQKPRGGEPRLAKVDPGQLAEWAEETEMASGGSALPAGQEWRVVAALAADRDSALVLQRRLRAAGYAAELAAGEPFAKVLVAGLATEAQARAVMGNLRAIPGVRLPKVEAVP